MDDGLTRAQHYRELADQMRKIAKGEPSASRRDELLSLAQQYEKLADKLVRNHTGAIN